MGRCLSSYRTSIIRQREQYIKAEYYINKNVGFIYLCEIKITNQTFSDFNFHVMSCTVGDHITINSDSIKVIGNDCLRNVPYPIKLKHNEIVTFTFLLSTQLPIEHFINCKIGFRFLPEQNWKENCIKWLSDKSPENNIYLWSPLIYDHSIIPEKFKITKNQNDK